MRVAIVVRVVIIEHEVAIVGESDDDICLSCNDFLSVRVAVCQGCFVFFEDGSNFKQWPLLVLSGRRWP